MAAEVQSIAWDSQDPSPTLNVKTKGKVEVTTKSLEKGLRLRAVFKDASLSKGVTDLGGRGHVKGVFPYLGDEAGTVYVDLLLKEKGTLSVRPANQGYRITASKTSTGAQAAKGGSGPNGPNKANALQDIVFTPLAGGRVHIKLKMKDKPKNPGTFSISKPARVAFDFFDTTNQYGNKTLRVAEGAVDSISSATRFQTPNPGDPSRMPPKGCAAACARPTPITRQPKP